MKKSDKGLVSEALAQAYFAKDPNLMVFTALGGMLRLSMSMKMVR